MVFQASGKPCIAYEEKDKHKTAAPAPDPENS